MCVCVCMYVYIFNTPPQTQGPKFDDALSLE